VLWPGMDRVSRFFGSLPGLNGGAGVPDAPVVDTAEKVQISSLALLKMLKHGEFSVRHGVSSLLQAVPVCQWR
jgi:26S proteasome regulatory subunit N11